MTLKHYLLLTLLILPCLFQSQETPNPQNIEENADSLIDLTEENFDQNVLSGDDDRWFIMFYAPWCPHCQDATPILNQLAKALDGKVKIGRVDCDANPGLRDKYSVQGVPTFLYLYKDEIHQYEGDRTIEAWTEFVNKGFKKTEDIEPGETKVVEEEAHSLISEERPDLNRENSEGMPRTSDLLVDLTDKNFDSQVKDDEKWFVMFYLPWCRHCEEIMPRFDSLANSLQDQLKFGKVDCDTEDELREKYSIHSYPTFLYFYKGESRQYQGDKTVEAWTDFVNNAYTTTETIEPEEGNRVPANMEENLYQENQQLENPQTPAQLPEGRESEALMELTDVNFNYQVLVGDERKWFIMFYHPGCPRCQGTMPDFIKLAESLQGDVSFGRIDCDANPYIQNRYAINDHPAFLFFYKGEVRQYEGDRTIEGWTDFVNRGYQQAGTTEPEENKRNAPISPEERPFEETPIPETQQQLEKKENLAQQPPIEERPEFESPQNIPQVPESTENIAPQSRYPKPENYSDVTPPPESIDYVVQQPSVEARPEFENQENITPQPPIQERTQPENVENIAQQPENLYKVSQQPAIEERPELESPQNIPQVPENLENITQPPPQERPQSENFENISQQPENLYNASQQPVEEINQPENLENITQPPPQERPQPENFENINQQPPVQEVVQPEIQQNNTLPLPVRERPLPESLENPTQLEGPDYITQQPPAPKTPQLESPENIAQEPETPENLTRRYPFPQPENLETTTQQLPIQETPQPENLEKINQPSIKERPEIETSENVIQQFENVDTTTQQPPIQESQQPESPENLTQAPVPDRTQPETLANIAQHSIQERTPPENLENITQQPEDLSNISQPPVERPELETSENVDSNTQQPPVQEVPQPESPENLTPAPVQETPQPEVLEGRSGALIDLTEDNFDNNVFSDNNRRWFVMFYAPWCPHCHDAMPTFEQLANSINDQASIARVDCEANTELRNRYSIQGYPTFLLFYKGEIHQYEGQRTVEAWSEFVNREYKNTEDQAPEENKAVESESTPLNLDEKVAAPQVPEIAEEKTDSLIDLNDDDFDNRVFSNEERWFIMFYAPWCPHCRNAMPAFGELANSLKDRVNVARVDCEANPGLRERYSIQGYPTFLFFYRGEIHQYEGQRTVEAWTEFATHDYKGTEAQAPEENKAVEANSTPTPLSQEPLKVPQERNPKIPTDETNFLVDLNKNNFNTKVFGNEDDRWLIMFYAPWCPHCKHAMPTFKELATYLDGHAKVGRVDCDANPELRNRFSIRGYPTFLFFSNGEVRRFEGERTIQAWSDFVNEGYKTVHAIEENVHGISLFEGDKINRTRFLTPTVLIVGGALVGAMLLFCFLAVSHRKHEDDAFRHTQLEDTSIDDDTRINVD